MIINKISAIALGYSEVIYEDKKYGVIKSEFNKGNSFKIYAKELGGKNVISLNYYKTSNDEFLKPCEMPNKKVVHFLNNFKGINNESYLEQSNNCRK